MTRHRNARDVLQEKLTELEELYQKVRVLEKVRMIQPVENPVTVPMDAAITTIKRQIKHCLLIVVMDRFLLICLLWFRLWLELVLV